MEEIKILEDKITQRITVKTTEDISIRFSDEVCAALGLFCQNYYNGTHKAPFNYNLYRGFHSLYVYCSLCEPQIVGDVYAQLLRSVAISGKRGEHVIVNYNDPHYVSVNTKQIDVIEINIKDDMDQNVSFMFGKVISKLHFRQRSL